MRIIKFINSFYLHFVFMIYDRVYCEHTIVTNKKKKILCTQIEYAYCNGVILLK